MSNNTSMIEMFIDGQQINIIKKPSIIEDSIKYLKMKVSFSEEWKNLQKNIIFIHKKIKKKIPLSFLNEQEFFVPSEVIKKPEFSFGFYGELVENEQVIKRIPTEIIIFNIEESIYSKRKDLVSVFDIYDETMKQVLNGELASVQDLKQIVYQPGEDKKTGHLLLTTFENEAYKISFTIDDRGLFTSFEYEDFPFIFPTQYMNTRLEQIRDTIIDLTKAPHKAGGGGGGGGSVGGEGSGSSGNGSEGSPLSLVDIFFYCGENGGEEFKLIEHPVGDTVHAPKVSPNPSEGYVFANWFYYENGEKVFPNFPIENVRRSMSFYCHFEKGYADALYSFFNQNKETFPYLAMFVQTGGIFVVFSESAWIGQTNIYVPAYAYKNYKTFYSGVKIPEDKVEDMGFIMEAMSTTDENWQSSESEGREDTTMYSIRMLYSNKVDCSSLTNRWATLY